MIGAPIFHVNGDDPEACLGGAVGGGLPTTVQKDVVIDMLCYRRRPGTTGDDPSVANPMYDVVDAPSAGPAKATPKP